MAHKANCSSPRSGRSSSYTNAAQQRLMKVVLALFADAINGYPPGVLAKAVACSQSVITRDLDNLLSAGWVERLEATGHWRLTPRLPQQAIKVFHGIDRAQRQVDEARQRFTRNPD